MNDPHATPHATPPPFPVFDLHQDTLSRLLNVTNPDLSGASPRKGHVDLPRLRTGGYRAALWALHTPDPPGPLPPSTRTLRMIGIALGLAAAHPDHLALARTPAEAMAAWRSGRFAAILSVENGSCLGGSIEVLHVLAHLGVVSVGLVWNGRNEIGDGAAMGTDAGLTPFGRQVVRTCGRLGVGVDVSHLNERGFAEVMDLAEGPILASHSNCRTLCHHSRNLHDAQIRALAARGGVLGLNLYPAFLVNEGPATADDVAGHARHAADLTGGAAVLAIGTDFDGIDATPQDIADVSDLPVLADALQRHGFSAAEVRAIFFENAWRLLGGGLDRRIMIPLEEG